MRWFANSEMLNLHSMKFGMTRLQVTHLTKETLLKKKRTKKENQGKKSDSARFRTGDLECVRLT